MEFLNPQLILSIVVGLSVLFIFVGVRSLVRASSEGTDHIQQFFETGQGPAPTLRQLEMRASFYRRVIVPIGAGLLRFLGRLVPQRNLDKLRKRLETAGYPGNLGVADFLGMKLLVAIVVGVLFAGLTAILRPDFSVWALLAVAFSFGLVGYLFPNLWLSRRIRSRQAEIRKGMPDALDMLSISVNAGLGFSGAMQHVADAWDNALCEEFTRAMAEVKLGRTRIEALESMAERTDVDEVKSFVASLALADRLGVSIAQSLRIQAEQMRVHRRQRAEELAREASIKMLFPLVFLIFPAMFAVLLGPAVPLILQTFTQF
jgi:tight adherence protein C